MAAMKQLSEQVYTTRVPVYDHKLKLIVSTDVCQSAHKLGVDALGAIACTLTHGDAVYILIPAGKRTLCTLVHEIIHAAFEILKRRDISTNYKNQEMLAYLSGWITRWVFRVVK
jgi:hypothetical protein